MTTAEFTKESEHNAWNYLGGIFDIGTCGCFATVVSQPRVGLCPDRGFGFGTPRGCYSRASRTYLDFAGDVEPLLRSPADEDSRSRSRQLEGICCGSGSTFSFFQTGRAFEAGGE
jgi:hypothetical protein